MSFSSWRLGVREELWKWSEMVVREDCDMQCHFVFNWMMAE